LNNIISRSLASIHFPTSLEPEGLHRDDGKRPDGVTLFPWSKGKSLAWDATCYDTFADSYISKTSRKAREAAELASSYKHSLYKELIANNYLFLAFAVETMGSWSSDSIKFIKEVGSKLQQQCGDKRSKFYLYQKLSLAIQRGNAASILGTIPPSRPLNEIFYL
jgi:hypothetical protein